MKGITTCLLPNCPNICSRSDFVSIFLLVVLIMTFLSCTNVSFLPSISVATLNVCTVSCNKSTISLSQSPRPEVVLVLSRSRSVTPQESGMSEGDGNYTHRPALINHVTSPRPPKILESPMDSKSLVSGEFLSISKRYFLWRV